jgi:thiopeptide-type bacteriocin biosynthesis protein
LAEQIFHADSDAVLAILRSLSGDDGPDLRWRLALRGIDLLFEDLGLSFEEKRSVARTAREEYGREFGVGGTFRSAVGQRYRTERVNVESLLDPRQGPQARLAPGLEVLRERSLRLAPLGAELRELARSGGLTVPLTDLATSYAHMHVNRLLRSAQRAQELVLYELLDRFYIAQAARRAFRP